jgi:hypothetical protein
MSAAITLVQEQEQNCGKVGSNFRTLLYGFLIHSVETSPHIRMSCMNCFCFVNFCMSGNELVSFC